MRRACKLIERSMMSATAITDASSNGQIGQPAAWMIANKWCLRDPKLFYWALRAPHLRRRDRPRERDAPRASRAAAL
jgi:hypothetical protein